MNKKEKELFIRGIRLGIFLALTDSAADMAIKRDCTAARLSAAKEDGEGEESIVTLRSQIEVYDKLCSDYTDYECNSVAQDFYSLTIEECNLVYDTLKELSLSNVDKVHDELAYVITKVLLCNE